MQSLKKIFWHNTLHMVISTTPFLLAWIITFIFPDDGLTKYVLFAVYVISLALMYYPIYVNTLILLDLVQKETITVTKQIEISPGWRNAGFGIKKKYIHEIFEKDYHNIFDICFLDGKKTVFLEMYIKNSKLRRTNFNKFFTVSYDGKNEIISKKDNKIGAQITFYKNSRIIKDILFYDLTEKPVEVKVKKTRQDAENDIKNIINEIKK